MKTLNTTLSNTLLIDILQQVRALIGQGKVANYIPALAEVANHHLAMAVCTIEGEIFSAGDAYERFSIQSISKVLGLTLAMTRYREDEIWCRVGKEPSGLPFNSLVQLEMEKGIPRNPLLMPGRLLSQICCSFDLARPSNECWNLSVHLPVNRILVTITKWRARKWSMRIVMQRLPI